MRQSREKQFELDFNENLYSEVNKTIFYLLGQKLDHVKLLNVSDENYIDILKPDNIQFARIDMLQDS